MLTCRNIDSIKNKRVQRRLTDVLSVVTNIMHCVGYHGMFFIAGGSVFSSLNGKDDYQGIDVFFYHKSDFDEAEEKFTNYVRSRIKNDDCEWIDSTSLSFITFSTENALIVRGMLPKDRELHIIRKHIGHPECVFGTFDLTNSMVGITCLGELISTADFRTKLKINFDSINGKTLSRYFKYIQKKGASDPNSEMLHALLDWIINNPYSQVQYGSENNYVDAIDMIFHLECYGVLDHIQYVHDSIVKHYSGQDRIHLFERIMAQGSLLHSSFYISNPCDEMNLVQIKKTADNKFTFDFLITFKQKGIYDKILDKYPEYFI